MIEFLYDLFPLMHNILHQVVTHHIHVYS